MLTETIFGPIWVWLFYNEIPPTSVFIGGLIIISAVVMKSLTIKKTSYNLIVIDYIVLRKLM